MNNKPHSEETKKKMSLAHKGSHARLGIKIPHTQETKDKIKKNNAKFWKGKKFTNEHRANLSANHCKKYSLESRIKKSKTIQGLNDKEWKGFITSINEQIRDSYEYRLWRKAVFERDGYQCVWGGKEHGSKLQADHIKSFSQYPELRFAIDNGRTLCKKCHLTTENYGRRQYKKNSTGN